MPSAKLGKIVSGGPRAFLTTLITLWQNCSQPLRTLTLAWLIRDTVTILSSCSWGWREKTYHPATMLTNWDRLRQHQLVCVWGLNDALPLTTETQFSYAFKSSAAKMSCLTQGRNDVRWRPGQKARLAPPSLKLRSFGSQCTVWRKYFFLVTL